MIHKLRFSGMGLIVALAIGSTLAAAASADVLTSESASVTTLKGKQGGTDVIKVHGGELKCTTVTYEGTFSTGASSVILTPTYSGCTFAGLPSTVDPNGCGYRLNVNTGPTTAGSVDIICSGTNEITITAPSTGTKKCIVHIRGQNDLTNATGTNIGGSGTTRELTVDINITNVAYSQTAGTAETGNCATADSTTGGTWEGDATFTGSVSSSHVGIFLS
jgi:hypothetical protein